MTSRNSEVDNTVTGVHDRVEFVGVPAGHHVQQENFNLERFEYQVTQADTETAARMLLLLLAQLDNHYGQWGPQFSAYAPGTPLEGLNPVLCTRIAGAVTTLFSRPDFTVSDGGYVQLMNLHRWLALIFAVSLYRHADHIIRNINAAGGGVVDPLTFNSHNLRLFCLCYFPDSQIALQPDMLWQYDRRTVARLFLALISGRALPTPAAHGKREQLLAWLPARLAELDSLDFLPTAVLHDVYMHCSYADLAEKHRIKRSLNDLIRRSLLAGDFADIAVGDNRGQTATDTPEVQEQAKKPVMLVVLEWFTGQHSVYRTHSRALSSLRERFTVHAVGLDTAVDAAGREVFDVFHGVSAASALQEAYALAGELRPDLVLYAGIGMFPFTIYLSNLRLAPLQLAGLGHGASTFCGQINGFVIEEDLVGEERCFSETVIRVPADAMPFVPPADIRRVPVTRTPFLTRQQAQWREPLPVRVAVCASIMKINPNFLATLAEIQRRGRVAVQFCFYMGFAQGLTLDYLRDAIHAVLPDAEVNAHMPVQAYQTALNSCELFVSPFPYGNMNGVVDAVRQGLPGVCLTGPEVHSHIDEGLFRRLGLPDALVATGDESYIRAVLRLVEEHDWREMLQRQLLDNDVEQVLFQGHPEKFAAAISDVWQQVRPFVAASDRGSRKPRRKSS
ncbi:cobalt ABC transporter permease [Salmonella enterica]|uniref:cobalt ABC transporter permease n=1 Tax=Salmonella enterica TaxID=28901 RepID=UPI0029C5508A|nr:cobalt ABC transporter permease [Salmonella enterica]QVC95582.1 cobalt ABC transporter permease [Salmonella enterica subsp. enterica serovar Newport]HCZ4704457.1 cobalt ABC transporter permease [Salmonella enterica subsp. enterica serovar Saintpaul str. CFSAN004145]EKF6307720.1 cobalt ABC transporter permease [Salmonella enterica]ELX8012162.1 cobalt ABC transporter permease [Salmonella enterica]